MINHSQQNRERELLELPAWLRGYCADYPHFWFMAWYGDYGIYVTMYEYGYKDSIVDEWWYPNVDQVEVVELVKKEIKPLLRPPLSSIWTEG